MGMCKQCGKVYSSIEMVDGYCQNCLPSNSLFKNQHEKNEMLKQLKENKGLADSIIVTTETYINENIEHRLGMISSQRIYGVNIIKDIFNFVRDIVGGRIGSLENALRDANNEIINDFKEQAYLKGGNAVIGIKIEHTYNNSGNGNILSVFATGTVVKTSKKD